MDWKGLGAFASGLVLQKVLGDDAPPNKVLEFKKNTYGNRQVVLRDGNLILYGPPVTATSNIKSPYEIVFHNSNDNGFSLYRIQSKQEAEDKFNALFQRLPTFLEIATKMYSVNGLQKLCDALIANPSWTLAHLAAHFNLTEYIAHPKIIGNVDCPDATSNMTPIESAIQSGNIEMVKALLPFSNLEHLDINGGSVFHYAAATTKEMIELLTTKTKTHLNHYNSDGYTPLHLACFNDRPGCVAALLMAGADVNLVAQKQQLSPLHLSTSHSVVATLIAFNCNVNVVNSKGQTALHVMVGHNRLDCVVSLLSHEAKIDIKDKNGNTSLHIAIEKKNVAIVRALVVFECDVDVPNKDGKTPRHLVGKDANGSNDDMILHILHTVGARRCPESSTNCPPGCHAKGSYNGIPPAPPNDVERRGPIQNMLESTSSNRTQMVMSALGSLGKEEKNIPIDTSQEQLGATYMDSLLSAFTEKKVEATGTNGRGRLLSLDGGGIRGLVLVQMLIEIERIAKVPITHMFDWIAGTSTGGVLALGLGCGKTLQQCMCLYLRLKEVAFVGSRPYPSEPLEQILKDTLGEFSVMSDIKAPKIMITGVMAHRKPVVLHLFRNYQSASDMLGIVTPSTTNLPPEKQLLWRAARATGAAPSYFRTFEKYLDGGLISNNPTLDAITEIHQYNVTLKSVGRTNEAVPISCVVSLGTGMIPVIELKDIDVFRPESIWDTAKLASGVSALGTLLVDQATAADGSVVDRARAWCSMIGVPYYRFNPQMSVDVAMDEKSDQVLINLLWETKAYMHTNRNRVIEMINQLK